MNGIWHYNILRPDGRALLVPGGANTHGRERKKWYTRAARGYLVVDKEDRLPVTNTVFLVFETACQYANAHAAEVISRQWYERDTGETIPVPEPEEVRGEFSTCPN